MSRARSETDEVGRMRADSSPDYLPPSALSASLAESQPKDDTESKHADTSTAESQPKEDKESKCADTATNDETIRIAIVDYDNTAVSLRRADGIFQLKSSIKQWNQFLSPALIKALKAKSYKALYGCTHRTCLSTAANILQFYKEKTEVDPSAAFTTQIGPNLSKATKIPLIEVSTPDDVNAPEIEPIPCGSGYRNFLTRYETMLAEKIKVKPSALEDERNTMETALALLKILLDEVGGDERLVHRPLTDEFDQTTKNNQLLSIIKDAAKRYPGKKLVFDFYDDKEEVLESTKTLKPDDLPPGCTLNIFYHCAAFQEGPDFKHSISSPSIIDLKLAFLDQFKSEVEDKKWDTMGSGMMLQPKVPDRIRDSRYILKSLPPNLGKKEKEIDQVTLLTVQNVYDKITKLIEKTETISFFRKECVSLFFELNKLPICEIAMKADKERKAILGSSP